MPDLIRSPRRNSTISGLNSSSTATITDIFGEVTKYNVQLNIIERLWASWYLWMQNDVLATGIMSFIMHELVYFGRSLPFMIADCIPALNKYKLQNVRPQVTSNCRAPFKL
jgi:methylsterol monooxygenase